MKTTTLILSAMISLLSINSATAAESIVNDQGKEKIGVISESNASTLEDLMTRLSQKADQEGATAYKIIATTGDNKIHGVAAIYK